MAKTASAPSAPSPSGPAAPLPPSAPRPLFAQLQERLKTEILASRLAPGAKLPSEAELEAAFGVSRITVRQALAELHKQGLIEKINGKGSFVTRPSEAPRLGPLTGFYEHARARGARPSGRTLSVRDVGASAAAAAALGVAPGTPLTQVRLLRRIDDVPVAYGIMQAAPDMARALLAHDLDENDVMSVLESRLGFRLASTQIEAGAVLAGAQRARLLGIAPTDPLVYISFTPLDVTGRHLCFSEMFFRADRFTYKATIKR